MDKPFFRKIFLLNFLLIGILQAGLTKAECPDGWETHDGFCYYFSPNKLPWNEAESWCQVQGGHLASILSADERTYIVTDHITGTTDGDYWIGYNDISVEGNWVWSDGSTPIKALDNWVIGTPDNKEGDEDCCVVKTEIQQQSDADWNDVECHHDYHFVCKRSIEIPEDCDSSMGFKKSGNYCYLYVDDKMTWHEAEQYCLTNFYSELTAVTSQAEQDYVASIGLADLTDVWIGLSDQNSPGTYQWSNGHDSLTYTNWAPNEPSTAAAQGSSCVRVADNVDGKWITDNCGSENAFMCRKGLRATCPDGWTYAHGKCYEFITNHNYFTTWTEANRYCLAQNSRLLKIENEAEQAYVAGFESKFEEAGIMEIYMGISDVGHDEHMVWADGSPIVYNKWDTNQPNTNPGIDDCAVFYTGKGDNNWESISCFNKQSFACEVYEGTPTNAITVPTVLYSCPDGWRLFGSNCYLFDTQDRTWDDAEQFCSTSIPYQGHLTSILNEAEQSFVVGHLKSDSWIGLRDLYNTDQFTWSDGMPYSFNYFDPNTLQTGPNNCAKVKMGDDYYWETDDCAQMKTPICKQRASDDQPSIPTVGPTDINDALCGNGYIHNPADHKCYKFVGEYYRTWSDSRQHCQAEGGDLASVNSPDEQAFIALNILVLNKAYVWVGGYDDASPIYSSVTDLFDNGWQWSDGSPLNYINWSPGNPDNLNNEDCLAMQTEDGYWNDADCESTYGYVCEKEDPEHTTPAPDVECNDVHCCYLHMGVEKGGVIPDEQLSCSSQMDPQSGADRGRLNTPDNYNDVLNQGPGRGAWIPDENDPDKWFQVDFIELREIRGIVSQGRNGLSQPDNQNCWTKKYKMKYRVHPDRDEWEFYQKSDGSVMEFDANFDQNTQVTNTLERPVFTTAMRIYLTDCRLCCAIRLEFLGCDATCTKSLGVSTNGDGTFAVIASNQITASSERSGYEANKGRLDYTESENTVNCWKPIISDNNQWIQADFLDYRKVFGIMMQGNPAADEWITSYTLQFSTDGVNFVDHRDDNGNIQAFPGPMNRNTIVEGYLSEAVTAKIVRIIPIQWSGDIAARFDVVGCEPEGIVTCSDKAEQFSKSDVVLTCPAGCKDTADWLWGTTIYTADSYVCAAAIHDGRITNELGGSVTLNRFDGMESYTGSTQNGITSQSWGSYGESFSFQGDHLGCPAGWQGWNNWCYYSPRYSVATDWHSARAICQSYNAELASINSKAEQDFISALILREISVDSAWIGMNSLDEINFYKWTDNSEVTYTRWYVDAPSGGEERCVEIHKAEGGWNDKPCSRDRDMICKMPKIPVNSASTEVDGCESGWLGYEGSCYLINLQKMLWVNAENVCADRGGHLAAVTDVYEQMWLTSQIAASSHPDDSGDFFIGLAAYILDSGQLDYRWSTGEPVDLTVWDKGEPNIQYQCTFPFLYEGVEYYQCISLGIQGRLIGPWCSPTPVYSGLIVPCEASISGDDQIVGCIVMDSETGYWSQAHPFGCLQDAFSVCERDRVGYTNAAPEPTTHPSGSCSSGWYGVSSSSWCYQINEVDVTSRLNFDGARTHCESQGANLVSIHSADEEAIIQSGVSGSSGSNAFWIGLKSGVSGYFKWTDGTTVTYTSWDTGEPNDYNNREECVEDHLQSDNLPYWNDLNCDAVRNWICKVQRGTTPNPPVNPPALHYDAACGSDVDWASFQDGTQKKCYYFGTTPVQSWQEAEQYCVTLGGHLTSILSYDEQSFLTPWCAQTGLSRLWIGLSQRNQNSQFEWTDGSPYVYTSWMGGQPDNANGAEMCVTFVSTYGLWTDTNCGYNEGFICQKLYGAAPNTPAPTPTLTGGCPNGWLLYGSKCFLEVGYTDASQRRVFADAEAYCNDLNGYLASIPNEFYGAFLSSQLFAQNTHILIGLHANEADRVFTWTDNEPVYYTNWNTNEPNNQNGEDCVELLHESYNLGKWNDFSCGESRPFFCNVWRSSQYEEVPPDNTGCPQGYSKWDTACYKVYYESNDQASWSDAQAKCKSDGTGIGKTIDLVSIWNAYENMYIQTTFYPDVSYESMWIGLAYAHNATNTQFEWVDSTGVYYTNWDENQPQDLEDGTGCVEMGSNGAWRTAPGTPDDNCDTRKPFMCKYETLESPTSSSIEGGVCEDRWVAFGDYCYFVEPGFSSADQKTWGDADSICYNEKNAYLASIHSDLENKVILSWIGQRSVWIGLIRNAYGGWDWIDQTGVDYVNWAEGEPNNYGEGEAAAEMAYSGYWNDQDHYSLRGYVCKKHQSYSYCTFPVEDRTTCAGEAATRYECGERGCCWDEGLSQCYYSRADAQCLESGGECHDYTQVKCDLGYEQFLCSGSSENRCCYNCAEDDQACQDNLDAWEEGDDPCINIGGTCQYNSNYCSHDYISNYCGGPANRQCCVEDPRTQAPGSTESPKTNDGGQTTSSTSAAITTPTTASAQVISSGLGVGGIIGIITVCLFVAGGIAAAIYFYLKGKPSMSSVKLPTKWSASKSTEQDDEDNAASGFDNPIVFNSGSSTSKNEEGGV